MQKAIEIAHYFVQKRKHNNDGRLGVMKLEKLLYYAQGFSLAIRNKTLFEEEMIADPHGPSIESVYKKYEGYPFFEHGKSITCDFSSFTKEEMELLDDIWNIFHPYNGSQMEEMVTNEPPWKEARYGLYTFDKGTTPIDLQKLKEYFQKEYIVQES